MIKIRLTSVCILLCLLCSLSTSSIIQAQSDTPPKPQSVQVKASDGLTLRGDFYALLPDAVPKSGAPAVLLLHDLNGNRADNVPLVKPLLQEGYHVLAVDLRGFGETGGKPDWETAVSDAQLWLNWLKQQPGVHPRELTIIGEGIGANLALIVCGGDPSCATSVALSPGLVDCDKRDCQTDIATLGKPAVDYFVTASKAALTNGLPRHSMLLVASQMDSNAKSSINQIVALAQTEVGVRLLPKEARGKDFLYGALGTRVITLIAAWLNEHTLADMD